jgi:hypothetical protein
MNTTTNTTQISKSTKVRPGLYRGTLTVEGKTFDWAVERGEAGINCDAMDHGYWQLVVNHDGSPYDYPTKADALAVLHNADWYIDAKWGLCTR